MTNIKKLLSAILCLSLVAGVCVESVFSFGLVSASSGPAQSKDYAISDYADWIDNDEIKFYSFWNNAINTTTACVELSSDSGNLYGLGANAPVLRIGNTPCGWRSPQCIVFDTTDDKYPICGLSGKMLVGNLANRAGSAIYTSKKLISSSQNANTKTTLEDYQCLNISMDTASDNTGFRLHIWPYNNFNIQTVYDSSNGNSTYTVPNSGGRSYGDDYTSSTIPNLAVDAQGNALSTAQKTALQTYLKSVASLSTSDRWIDFAVLPEKATGYRVELTLNLSGYGEYAAENDLPLKLTIVYAKLFDAGYASVYGAGAFNGNGGDNNGDKTFFGDKFTVKYDISSYVDPEAKEFMKEIDEYVTTGHGSVYKKSDITAINAILQKYDSFSDSLKASLDTNKTSSVQLVQLRKAKQKLDAGADYYDDFESGINWELTDEIPGDTFVPTNDYSEAAASEAGKTENGKTSAFWGIHGDSEDSSNNVLWLRKAFSENVVPINGALVDGKGVTICGLPTVAYKQKNLLPENSKVASVSGRLYLQDFKYGGSARKYVIGVVYKQPENGEMWRAVGIGGDGRIGSMVRRSETVGANENTDNNSWFMKTECSVYQGYEEATKAFRLNQWIEFDLSYNFAQGAYVYTVSGLLDDGTTQISKYILPTANNFISDVMLVNGGVTCQSFDDIAMSALSTDYVKSLITNLGDVDSLTIDNECDVKSAANAYKSLSEAEKAEINNYDKLKQALEKIKSIIAGFDASYSLQNTITFEGGQAGAEYFTTTNAALYSGFQTVDNPFKTGFNTSDKVLNITKNFSPDNESDTRRAVYKIKDGTMSGENMISNISGKVYLEPSSTTTLIFDYTSDDVWQGVQLYFNTGRVTSRLVSKKAGNNTLEVGKQAYCNKYIYAEDTLNGNWINFDISYSLLKATISVEWQGTDGIIDLGKWGAFTLSDTCETRFAVCTQNLKYCYLDDINIKFQNNDDYLMSNQLLTNNAYILSMIPAKTYISETDRQALEKLKSDYNALSDIQKHYIPFVSVQIQMLEEALTELSAASNAAQMTARDEALKNKALAAGSNYTTFDFSDNFEDGLRSYIPVCDINTGEITTEYNSDFGSNVLKMTGESKITVKDMFLPEKTKYSKISYRVKLGAEPSDWNRLRVYYRFIDDGEYTGYGWTKNEDVTQSNCRAFSSINDSGLMQRPPVDSKLNLNEIWNVEIVYTSSYNFVINITDQSGNTEQIEGKNESPQSKVVLVACDRITYYDDFKVTYEKGRYDVDQENKDITVYYTANTFVKPGDVGLLSGENLGKNVRSVEIMRVPDQVATGNPAYTDRTYFDYDGVHDGEFSILPSANTWDETASQTVKLVQKTSDSVKFIVPTKNKDASDFKEGIYAVKINSITGNYRIVYINMPSIDYTYGNDGETVSPGEILRIVGKNIAPSQASISKGDKAASDLRAVLVRNGNVVRELDIPKIQSEYSVSVAIPSDITVPQDGSAEEYELYIYNGFGDSTCYAIPYKVHIAKSIRSLWPTTVFNVRDYGCDGTAYQNATPYVMNAISALSKNGGGVLYFPKGVYRLNANIVLPQKCIMTGDSKDDTVIFFTPHEWLYDKLPVANVNFMRDVEISNIYFAYQRAGGVFKGYGPSSDNVYIHDVRVDIYPMSGTPSEAGIKGVYTALTLSAELKLMVATEKVAPILTVATAGTNFHLVNFDASHCYGNHRQIVNDFTGSQYWQMDNLSVSSYFSQGWSEFIVSSSLVENCNFGPSCCVGGWGHGVYYQNNYFHDTTGNNRELFVADRAPNYRGSIKAVEGSDTEYTATMSIPSALYRLGQIYIVTGQGAGQTRTIVSSLGSKLKIDRPFTIKPNSNSVVVMRRPRENIYFIDNTYQNGACGGFYGGFADVIYDGNTHIQNNAMYQWAIFGDVNWYLSIVNDNYVYSPGIVSPTTVGDTSVAYTWMADSGENSQLCFLLRNNELDGTYMSISSKGSKASRNIIIDNNKFSRYSYAISSNNLYMQKDYIDGVLMYRNMYDNVDSIFDSAIQGEINTFQRTTNSVGSKQWIDLDSKQTTVSEMFGDVNADGRVSLKDCTLIKLYLIGAASLSDSQMASADVDGDGKVTLKDATQIRITMILQQLR